MLTFALLAAALLAPAPLAPPPPGANPQASITPQTVEAIVKALPTKRSPRGGEEGRAGLAATEKLLAERLTALGYAPSLEEIGSVGVGSREIVWHNIIVEIPGTQLKDEVIIIGAHFDAVAIAPGADDNGTGVACLLEMARVLKAVPMKRTVRLCFFNLEESGLVGSRWYAGQLDDRIRAGKEKVIGAVSLDEIGYFSDAPASQAWPPIPIAGLTLPTVGDFIAVGGLTQNRRFSQPLILAMREAEPACKVFAGDILPIAVPDFLRSDHAPFLAIGVPAVIVSDTANFRNPNYHKATDTVETIDWARTSAVVRALAGAAISLANRENFDPPPVPGQPPQDPTPAPAPPSPAAPAPTDFPHQRPKPPGQSPEVPR